MPGERGTATLAAAGIAPDGLRERVAERAGGVDAGTDDPRRALGELAAAGLLTLGVPGRDGTVAEQAAVLAELAEDCMATAFCAWGHRMSLEYIAPAGGEHVEDLAALRRIGSSAMASALKAHLGLAPLPVTARRERGGALVLDGRIPWASNLHADAIAVLGAQLEDGDRIVIALPLETEGVSVRPARGLLALEATASGQLVLESARLDPSAEHPEDFAAFVRRIRRPFLALQSAFCLGLARTALAAAEPQLADGLGAELADEAAGLAAQRDELTARLAALADDPAAPPRELVRLRLDAAVLAREAVRVEAAVTGGRGYVSASPTARRLREAAFLPVQSPTETQLRWELRQAA